MQHLVRTGDHPVPLISSSDHDEDSAGDLGGLDRYRRCTGADTIVPAVSSRRPTLKRGDRFIKGPLPLRWIGRAAVLPGKACQVALALWFRRGMEGPNSIALSRATLDLFGVDRHAGYRALRVLEQAGLVSITRRCGKTARVTLLDVPREV